MFDITLISNNVDTVIIRTRNCIITVLCNEIVSFRDLHYSNTGLVQILMVRLKTLSIITNWFYYVETLTMRAVQLKQSTKTIRLLNDELFVLYEQGQTTLTTKFYVGTISYSNTLIPNSRGKLDTKSYFIVKNTLIPTNCHVHFTTTI